MTILVWGFAGCPTGKDPTCQCRTHKRCSSIPGSGRCHREGHGNPLQYFCLKNPIDRGAWLYSIGSWLRHHWRDLVHTYFSRWESDREPSGHTSFYRWRNGPKVAKQKGSRVETSAQLCQVKTLCWWFLTTQSVLWHIPQEAWLKAHQKSQLPSSMVSGFLGNKPLFLS